MLLAQSKPPTPPSLVFHVAGPEFCISHMIWLT